MIYILRTNVKNKNLLRGLCNIYGIGFSQAGLVCKSLGFQKKFLVNLLEEKDYIFIPYVVEKLRIKIKGELKRWLKLKIDNLSYLKTYRGSRHRQNLPVRGQRTHTNARTAKNFKKKRKF
uniref:Ribosomal protein S13 n=1 Tax=Vischeria stellata TaxID=1104407 RepID=A0A481XG80_9STRA|nr:ribosomal protein S13 [Vischeria stellata]QBK36843.1 ribosomal protein S13 [Vischeria stellata]